VPVPIFRLLYGIDRYKLPAVVNHRNRLLVIVRAVNAATRNLKSVSRAELIDFVMDLVEYPDAVVVSGVVLYGVVNIFTPESIHNLSYDLDRPESSQSLTTDSYLNSIDPNQNTTTGSARDVRHLVRVVRRCFLRR